LAVVVVVKLSLALDRVKLLAVNSIGVDHFAFVLHNPGHGVVNDYGFGVFGNDFAVKVNGCFDIDVPGPVQLMEKIDASFLDPFHGVDLGGD
jgi:hypothetical protein